MKRLTKAIQSGKTRTITVDIFDTVLLRKIYPEELQFLKHAERASVLLKKRWDRDISPFCFYSFRQYVRRVLARMQYSKTNEWEVSIRDIFAQTLESIAQKESVALERKSRDALVDILVQEELEIEKKSLRPNRALVSALRICREKGLRVYFVSDMYLETEHIQALLRHFGIDDAFDGGISSASAGYCKWNGGLFTAILKNNLIPDFSNGTNVHIGDNWHADVRSARKLKMATIHYRSLHTLLRRPVLRFLGTLRRKWKIRLQKKTVRRLAAQALKAQSALLKGEEERCLFEVGFILGPAVAQYLSYVDIWSRASGEPMYFVSSEADTLLHLSEMLHIKNNTFHTLPALNRLRALQQFLYLGISKTESKDPFPILSALLTGHIANSNKVILNQLGIHTKDLPLPFYLYEKIPQYMFLQSVSALLRDKPHLLENICAIHESVLAELKNASFPEKGRVIIADVGWSGTIQSLLQQSLNMLDHDVDMEGIYLGQRNMSALPTLPESKLHYVIFHNRERLGRELCVEEIWEYALCDSEEEKHRQIFRGIEQYVRSYVSDVPSSPEFALECLLRPLRRLFHRPSRLQIMQIGSIKHQTYIGSTYSQPIIQLTLSRSMLLKTFFFDPQQFQAYLAKQFWQEGFFSWYKLRFVLPLLWLNRWVANLLEQGKYKRWHRIQ